jgi:hypothetical protein
MKKLKSNPKPSLKGTTLKASQARDNETKQQFYNRANAKVKSGEAKGNSEYWGSQFRQRRADEKAGRVAKEVGMTYEQKAAVGRLRSKGNPRKTGSQLTSPTKSKSLGSAAQVDVGFKKKGMALQKKAKSVSVPKPMSKKKK